MIKEKRSWSKPHSQMIARKKIDWSIFSNGSHIPIEFHEDFEEANHGTHVNRGEKYRIKLILDDEVYDAQLTNVDRKGVSVDSLQIRYDNNAELKQVLLTTFNKSYEYIRERKLENEKQQIHVPMDQAEYIEFYKTENPFVYTIELDPFKRISSNNFWWVNQGKTHNQERSGSYLWAPQRAKNGSPLAHHTDLLKAKKGDIVFVYSNMHIRCLGIVSKEAEQHAKPKEIQTDEWQVDGNLLKVNYFDLNKPIPKIEIPAGWRIEEKGPFDKHGDIKQGYFYSVSKSFANQLYSMFGEGFPMEIKNAFLDKDSIVEKGLSDINGMNVTNHIHSFIQSKGFFYKKEEVVNFYLSLKTKPFVILSGISGTGKTKMVQWFAESLGATDRNGQFTLIPVRPDWSDGSDLLGYVDIKGDFKKGPLTSVLERAMDDPTKPFFVLLDEMNLARVEYYFSDLLSVMESRRRENGEIITTPVLPFEVDGRDIILPSNVYIVGTVNMDETTHPFSKKVLDRANTIEFNRVQLDHFAFLEDLEEQEPLYIENQSLAGDFLHLKDAYKDNITLIKKVTEVLVDINKQLEGIGAQVGYRVRDEICFYVIYSEKDNLLTFKETMDQSILQKILPRISGSDERVWDTLKGLYMICTNQVYDTDVLPEFDKAIYPKSAQKIVDMIRRYQLDGFTSFWIGS
ncbi:McrB family protein [Fictibacillus sp. 26RED30]|uniref:McrB family protein n=1 Tax=Fictibacillus sp. 26RED30 TaxID=2745877 RepID=UPI0018CE97BA|nr:AAA family ATPase [Fictibacillus sp. 26RED30]MBH0160452.1 AAA family ATPase [Fictibacillus sp. 26RED30]